MIVVADLALVGQDKLLKVLFGEVVVPPAVAKEFARLSASGGRFALLQLPAWIGIRDPQSVPASIARLPTLDAGEAEALALALEIQADAVLMDERCGRTLAVELGLIPIGVFGILVRAKQNGHLAAVAPVMEELLVQSRFRASPELLREVLRLAGEG